MKVAATIVSYLFHPLWMATYLALVLGFFMPRFLLIPSAATLTFAGLVLVMTGILPALNLFMFKSFGTLPSLQMKTRRERIVPFLFITIIYAVVTFMFFYKVKVNINFNKVMLIVSLLVLAATIITLFKKVSIHSLAICGAVGILLPLNRALDTGTLLWPTVVFIGLAGAVMSARLYLNAHTPREVYLGGLAGFAISFFGMIFLF